MENHQWIFDNRPAAVKCHPEFKTRKGDAIVHLHMLGGTDNLDQICERFASTSKPASIQVTISTVGIKNKDEAFIKLYKCISEIVENKSETPAANVRPGRTNSVFRYCRRHYRSVLRRLRSIRLFRQ